MIDVYKALDLAAAICGDTDSLTYVEVPGPPASKSRPRFTKKGRVYHDPKDADAERRTGWHLKSAMRTPHTGNVALGCIFYRPNRQIIDVDNMLKHVCDAANGICWEDDSQVTAVLGLAEYDPDNPRTLVIIGKHLSTLTRGTDATRPCANCGGPIYIVKTRDSQKTCSARCKQELKGTSLAEPVPCPTCGERFRRKTSSQKYCSRGCVQRKGVPRGAATTGTCIDCGRPTSRPDRARCRVCWKASEAQSGWTPPTLLDGLGDA